MKMNIKSKKAMVLISLIRDYREFALTARDCGEFFGTMAGIDWELVMMVSLSGISGRVM